MVEGKYYKRLNRKQELVSAQFKERIMLTVTELNCCEACSFAHTKFALEEGMSPEEIGAINNRFKRKYSGETMPAIIHAIFDRIRKKRILPYKSIYSL